MWQFPAQVCRRVYPLSLCGSRGREKFCHQKTNVWPHGRVVRATFYAGPRVGAVGTAPTASSGTRRLRVVGTHLMIHATFVDTIAEPIDRRHRSDADQFDSHPSDCAKRGIVLMVNLRCRSKHVP